MVNLISSTFSSVQVSEVFDSYPDAVGKKLLYIRELIFETALEIGVEGLEETLKWGEPSYVTKHGSTLRIAWRKSFPKEVGIFFHCKTTLVDTFKEVYRDQFKYEGNRAILFNLKESIPDDALKHCIALSLTYHKIKHLPMLGI
jgi:hypothetical protein